MVSLKLQVVCAWFRELVADGKASKGEVEVARNCLEKENNIGPLVALVNKTGDKTPLEILASRRSNDNTYPYSGRPRIGS